MPKSQFSVPFLKELTSEEPSIRIFYLKES